VTKIRLAYKWLGLQLALLQSSVAELIRHSAKLV